MRQSEERSSDINTLNASSSSLFTGFPQKLWKIRRHRQRAAGRYLSRFVLIFLCILSLVACSMAKKTYKRFEAPPPDTSLVTKGEDDVRKKMGEPTRVSKTPDNHVLWVYQADWKLVPDNAGTVYVEFVDGRVVQIFQIKREK